MCNYERWEQSRAVIKAESALVAVKVDSKVISWVERPGFIPSCLSKSRVCTKAGLLLVPVRSLFLSGETCSALYRS